MSDESACPCFTSDHHGHGGHCCLDGLPDDCGQGAALPCGHRYGEEVGA